MPSFIIAGYVSQISGRGALFFPLLPHPWATPKKSRPAPSWIGLKRVDFSNFFCCFSEQVTLNISAVKFVFFHGKCVRLAHAWFVIYQFHAVLNADFIFRKKFLRHLLKKRSAKSCYLAKLFIQNKVIIERLSFRTKDLYYMQQRNNYGNYFQ